MFSGGSSPAAPSFPSSNVRARNHCEISGARFGPSVLAFRIGENLEPSVDHVIDSIRNPAEVEWFRANIPGFQLWNVTADTRTRFGRIKVRKRESDPQTLQDFLAVEEMEATAMDASGQDLEGTAQLADVAVPNDTTLDELEAMVAELLGSD